MDPALFQGAYMLCIHFKYSDFFVLQCKGFKSANILAVHQPIDICRGVVIDSLHCVYLGVTYKLITLWFGKESRNKNFSIRLKVG